MKKIDAGQIVSIAANIGVLVGIALVAIELRQNNQLLRAEAITSVLDTRMFVSETNLTNGELAEISYKAQQGEALTGVEASRIEAGNRRIIEGYERDYLLYEAGILPPDLLEAYLPRMKHSFASEWTSSVADVWSQYQSYATP